MVSPEPFFAKNVLEILGQRFPEMTDRWASAQAASIVANKERDTEHPVKVDDAEARGVVGEQIYRSLRKTVINTATKLLEIEWMADPGTCSVVADVVLRRSSIASWLWMRARLFEERRHHH
jgi:hypothetical protein